MTAANDLARMVPGFDFLQNLMKGAGASLPGLQGFGQWVAPTLDPEELGKRIQELKTVQFWLEQNARLLGTTVQALEVQRMTLSTLQTMNLPMADLREALKARAPAAETPAPTPAAAPAAPAAPAVAAEAAPGAVDPMAWWGALTQQFTEIATNAVKDSAFDTARHMAGSVAKAGMKAGVQSAGKTLSKAAGTLEKATGTPKKAARAAAPRRRKT
jgi:hypothetical protein